MSTDPTTIPSLTDMQQAKKDMDDINTFTVSTSDSFVDNTGRSRRTMEGVVSDVHIGGKPFENTAAGITATTDGNYFSVVSPSDDNYLDLYKNESGVAVFKKSYPSAEVVAENKLSIRDTDLTNSITQDATNQSVYETNNDDDKIHLYADSTGTKSLAHLDKKSGYFKFNGLKGGLELEDYIARTNGVWGSSNLPIFSSETNGFWYDPSDISTLFQDVGMTVPVVNNGDQVAIMLDKSGNENHLTLTNASYSVDEGVSSIFINGGHGDISNPEMFNNIASLTGSISFELDATVTQTNQWLLFLSYVPTSTKLGLGTFGNAKELKLFARREQGDTNNNTVLYDNLTRGDRFNTSFSVDYLGGDALTRFKNKTVGAKIPLTTQGLSSGSTSELAAIGKGVSGETIKGNLYGASVRVTKLPLYHHEKLDQYLTEMMVEELPSEINLFITWGQSNADGRVTINDGPEWIKDSKVDNVKVWDSKTISPYDLRKVGKEGNGSSWVINQTVNKFSFLNIALKGIAETLDNVVVCNVTSGGTALSPDDYARGSWSPDYDEIAANTPRLLEDLVDRLNNLISFCSVNNIVINFKGIICHQGESDSQRSAGDPAAYLDRWTRVISILRNVAEDPNLPVIYGTVPSSSLWYSSVIRQAHLDYAASDANAYCRDNDSIALLPDNLHFDAQGSTEFGDWVTTTYNNLGGV